MLYILHGYHMNILHIDDLCYLYYPCYLCYLYYYMDLYISTILIFIFIIIY